jgi:Pyruvate kinase, barrel domain
MGSRRHLNIRSKSANLPAITERDWQDIDFGIEVGVDFYALSFVRDAACIYELQAYLKRHGSHAKARSNTSGTYPMAPIVPSHFAAAVHVHCTQHCAACACALDSAIAVIT